VNARGVTKVATSVVLQEHEDLLLERAASGSWKADSIEPLHADGPWRDLRLRDCRDYDSQGEQDVTATHG
jgi:hypothetical protein